MARTLPSAPGPGGEAVVGHHRSLRNVCWSEMARQAVVVAVAEGIRVSPATSQVEVPAGLLGALVFGARMSWFVNPAPQG